MQLSLHLVHRLSLMFVCDLEVTTPFWSTWSLQRVNQLKGAVPYNPVKYDEILLCHYFGMS